MNKFHFYKSKFIEIIVVEDKILEFSEHCHSSDYVITAIIEGTATLKRNGNTQTLFSGDCFSLMTYENHTLFSDSPVSMISVCIKKSMIEFFDYQQYYDQINKSLFSITEYINFEYIDFIKNSAINLYSKCYAFNCDEDDTMITSINNIVVKPETEKSIEQLAAENYMSKYHFIRKFRKISGLTPHKFQIQSRIRKSQQLLIDGHDITETALLVGFYDQSHFDKYFKMIVGISPTEYVSSISNFLQA